MDPALKMLLISMQKDIREHRAETAQKFDQLFAFKWKIVGVTSAVSIAFGIIIQITIAVIGGK